MLGRSNHRFMRLLLFALLLGATSAAQAVKCSDPPFFGLIDGDTILGTDVPTITIDMDCTFQNFPASNPLTPTINFQTTDPSIYLIVFDNVVYNGNMACASVDHKIWFTNGSDSGIKASCQDLYVPAETIDKQSPASVGIGDPFTYTLTLPSMDLGGGPSPNDLSNVIVIDDLNATGADLSLVGTPVVTLVGVGALSYTYTNVGGLLTFNIPSIGIGDQIVIKITAVLNDTPANVVGTSFTNTAKWQFVRGIDVNEDGFIDPVTEKFTLQGEWGIATMVIAEPILVMTKSSADTTLSPGLQTTYSLDLQNIGGSNAWSVSIKDQIPVGLCDYDPLSGSGLDVQLVTAGGAPLLGMIQGVHYLASYSASPGCNLNISLVSGIPIGPTQRLIVSYQSELDATATNGMVLTNVAGATQWFSSDGTYPNNIYTRTISDGTTGTPDHEDAYTITAALTGFYFQKTVQNLTTGANPATSATPGDTLRYKLRLYNVDQIVDDVTITDSLDPTLFDTSTFTPKTLAPGSVYTFNNVTGLLTITGFSAAFPLNIPVGNEIVIEFDINLVSDTDILFNGKTVPNQALLNTNVAPVITNVFSDNPQVNGIDVQGDAIPPDSTDILIESPGQLLKENTLPALTTATIGEQFTYTITIPEVPVGLPLNDVKIMDDLTASNADMAFVSATVVSGGTWTLSNTGSATFPVIEDLSTGIDIPANGQAVIEITVILQNTLTNQGGLLFNNTASYTYNRINGINAPQSVIGAASTVDMTVVEPNIATITKVADNLTPIPGDIVRYTVTLTASGGTGFSDVFDVAISDNLDLGLVYAGNTTVTVGAGVAADNTIGDPDITGDGITLAQTLDWDLNTTIPADIDIVAGTSVTVSYDVQVLNSVLANQVLNNSVVALWTGIDGVSGAERKGVDGIGGLNDYSTAAVSATLTTPDIVSTIAKTRTTDTYGAADTDVRIGDIVEYTLTMPVPEGTLGNLQLVDTLPQGLKFEGIVSINGNVGPSPFTAVAPFVHADILAANIVEAGDAATGPSTVTWDLGSINNSPNDGLSDDFVIIYRARVLNNVIAHNVLSATLNNTVTMSYDTGTGTVINSDIDTIITAIQPSLTVTKSALTTGGDTVIDAGEIVTYTVDIVNSGTAPAYDVIVQDIIPVGMRNGVATVTTLSIDLLSGASYAVLAPTYDATSGIAVWDFDIGVADAYTVPANDTLRIVYQVQADAVITPGLVLTNSAQVMNFYSFDNDAVPTLGGVAGIREAYGVSNIASTSLYTGALPTKALLTPAQATIGDEVVYQIAVPGTASGTAIYDLQITDVLDPNLEFVSATVTGGGIGVTDTSIASQMNVAITEIPAGQQAFIELRTRVRNITTAQQGVNINNTASYTYAYTAGGATLPALTSADIVTVTLTEAQLIVNKVATPVTPAPITGGDIVEYVLTVQNTGDSTAYDVNVTDTLPVELQRDTSFVPTALINGAVVPSFVAAPLNDPAGPLIWGRGNVDGSLDIPAGQSLVLTYRAVINVVAEANISITNSVLVDWSSMNDVDANERSGAGCPTVIAPNDYCSIPASASIITTDTNTLVKTVINDSYAPAGDATVRVGDVVSYRLELGLQEGLTRNVSISDVLPAGMEFDSVLSINGDSTADYTPPATGAGSNYSYAAITAANVPATGASGTVSWTLGNISNDPLGDATTDILVIEYSARVIENVAATIAQAPSSVLTNTATLAYLDGTGALVVDPARLASSSNVSVLQPVMDSLAKTDRLARASPLVVDIVADTMQFRVSSCNTSGLAPAYNVQLADVLATQLNETTITGPVNGAGSPDVYINGVLQTVVTDYIYTAPAARGGSMSFQLIAPVGAGQCVDIDYDVGFYTDIPPNQIWNNSASVDTYYSLDGQLGQSYPALAPVTYIMTNAATIELPAKTTLSPLTGEATIGEEVVYQISVPSVPKNAILYDVNITDTLASSLTYVGATEVSGNGFVLTDNSTLPGQVSLSIAQIPAGQQAVIELRTRVDNSASANAGNVFSNIVNYTFADSAGGLQLAGGSASTATSITVVEPLLGLIKSVANFSNPGQPPTAGDTLRYSLVLTASGGAPGDNFSDALDVSIEDSLSLGLAYSGNPQVTGAGNTITAPAIVGDGVSVAQTLSWNLAASSADIDIPEGTAVTVTYDVLVLDSVLAGQDLSNSAIAQWSSIDGTDINERNGSATPAVNDYFSVPATTVLTTPVTNAISKTILNETYGAVDGTVRIGDVIDYELRINLQEGISPAVSLVDNLPQGLQFETVVSINGNTVAPFAAVAPFIHNDIAVPVVTGTASTGPTTLTWNIGDITNSGDNNPANNDFVIVYRARVLNGALPQVNSITLANTVNFNYNAAAGVNVLTSNVSVTALQPLLTVAKTVLTAGGDSIIDSNELITYTVDITNSGTAPAYDTVLQDIIPVGLRNGAATITMVSNSLLVAGTTPPNIVPAYDPATGIASWNFDSGVADQYNIPAGDTLQVIYQVQADATLSAGMTLINQAQVQSYYSFDNDAVATLGAVTGVSETYGPSNIATVTLTTAAPNQLSKQNPATLTAAVGDSFTYRITVPSVPMTTALNDVRILDDLTASAADLGFVSVTRISGSQPWTPVNTGTASNLIIEDTVNGIDIPAGEQVVIDITVLVNDSLVNVSGLLFNNTANYSFNQVNNDIATQSAGVGDTTADMNIIGPDSLTMVKTGPAQMNPGIAEVFTLDVQNTGTATAWDLSITDVLPNLDPAPGGMCDIPPANITAQIFDSTGLNPVSGVLVQGADYTATFAPSPSCTLTLTMISAAAALPAGNRLIVNYEGLIDLDNPQGTNLTNVAGATEWFSGDTAGAGATGQIRTYVRTLTDGTVATLDHEDAHITVTQSPVIEFYKTVVNVTSGLNTAQPGDTLRYSLLIKNISIVTLTDFAVTDEVDRLNASPMFAPGSLTVVSPLGTAINNSDANGGTNGTGLMDVSGLTLDPAGGANDTRLIEFEVTLAPVITSATAVLNQAQLYSIVTGTLDSDEPVINGPDDPTVKGDEDPTPISIISAPAFEVLKISQDLTGDPTILETGDTLRYTITVKNVGSEDAINVQLRDQIPDNTNYLAGSTSLNGVLITDAAAGVSPLNAGMLINSTDTAIPGYLVADIDPLANNVATIRFDVVVSANAINGAVISNQGFVNGDGKGSGPFAEQVTDDPGTANPGDPTVDVLGSLPLVDSLKTVALQVDGGTPGIVDPGDTLLYTITISNAGASPATGVFLVDATPVGTSYVANSVQLNGYPIGQPDGAVSPLIAGIDISSSDLPLPAVGTGTLTPGQTATVTFEVLVDITATTGTVISNQGVVSSAEQVDEPTDADGIDSNGDQVTQIVVGNAQLLSITKEVFVVGGGAAVAGGQLEYVIRVTNIGTVPANNVVINDNLDIPVAGQKSYMPGSATLNGSTVGVSYAAAIITADYSTNYGDLLPGEIATLRFLVYLEAVLPTGTTVTNNAQVYWNAAAQNAIASVSIDVGGMPGVASLNGVAWLDGNFNKLLDAPEQLLAGWFVDIYRNGVLLGTVITDANGVYQANGLAPNDISGDQYQIRFRAPGAGANTALLGMGDSVFTNSLHRIADIILDSGSNTQNLNLLLNPNGVVYNSVMRTPVIGSTLTMVQASSGTPLSTSCFDDPAQQGQVTPAEGYYRFDINFSDASCTPGSDYLINIVAPASGYIAAPSNAIPAVTDASAAAYSVVGCSADAVAATTNCEAQTLSSAPATNVAPGIATNYYMHLTLSNGTVPQESQMFNNHIPIDPDLSSAVTISKTSSLLNVKRGDMVPYTITANNTLAVPIVNINVVDTIPPGFRYVKGSARINGIDTEPVFDGLALTWAGVTLDTGNKRVIQLLLVVGSGVSEGEYINRAQMIEGLTGSPASPEATATVHVVPDPTFDCTDVIGKVFDDANMNGYQDEAEEGIANARIISARGLIMKTDAYGRFHISCAVVPNQDRGSNFILKLDERSLPSGYRVTTENPRVQRATRGKMIKFNFGATIHRVVRLDVADPVFEKNKTEIRMQWKPRLNILLDELSKKASVLRISYLADIEHTGLVDDRLVHIKQEIMKLREQKNCCSSLTVETEIFWRRGRPPSRGSID